MKARRTATQLTFMISFSTEPYLPKGSRTVSQWIVLTTMRGLLRHVVLTRVQLWPRFLCSRRDKATVCGSPGSPATFVKKWLTWTNRWWDKRKLNIAKGSPLLLSKRQGPGVSSTMTDQEHIWLKIRVTARAEPANAEPMKARGNGETRSQGSSKEEDIISC